MNRHVRGILSLVVLFGSGNLGPIRSFSHSSLSFHSQKSNMLTTLFASASKQVPRIIERKASSWGAPPVFRANEGEIPIIDVGPLVRGEEGGLQKVAEEIRQVFAFSTGFFMIRNHGYEKVLDETFELNRHLHANITEEEKKKLPFSDNVGYMKLDTRALPYADQGNMNEAFIAKREHFQGHTMNHNLWPSEESFPGFRKDVEKFSGSMESLGMKLVPAFAVALGLPEDFFLPAFNSPVFRLRLNHYPPGHSDRFGIAPHTDASFFTFLTQDTAGGLCVAHGEDYHYVSVPGNQHDLCVITGNFLAQWSQDVVASPPHFVVHDKPVDRYSLSFFFNADGYSLAHQLPPYSLACPAEFGRS